jgi:hypothetical protein
MSTDQDRDANLRTFAEPTGTERPVVIIAAFARMVRLGAPGLQLPRYSAADLEAALGTRWQMINESGRELHTTPSDEPALRVDGFSPPDLGRRVTLPASQASLIILRMRRGAPWSSGQRLRSFWHERQPGGSGEPEHLADEVGAARSQLTFAP